MINARREIPKHGYESAEKGSYLEWAELGGGNEVCSRW